MTSVFVASVHVIVYPNLTADAHKDDQTVIQIGALDDQNETNEYKHSEFVFTRVYSFDDNEIGKGVIHHHHHHHQADSAPESKKTRSTYNRH